MKNFEITITGAIDTHEVLSGILKLSESVDDIEVVDRFVDCKEILPSISTLQCVCRVEKVGEMSLHLLKMKKELQEAYKRISGMYVNKEEISKLAPSIEFSTLSDEGIDVEMEDIISSTPEPSLMDLGVDSKGFRTAEALPKSPTQGVLSIPNINDSEIEPEEEKKSSETKEEEKPEDIRDAFKHWLDTIIPPIIGISPYKNTDIKEAAKKSFEKQNGKDTTINEEAAKKSFEEQFGPELDKIEEVLACIGVLKGLEHHIPMSIIEGLTKSTNSEKLKSDNIFAHLGMPIIIK